MSVDEEITLQESSILRKTVKKVFPDAETLKQKCPKLFMQEAGEDATITIEIAEVIDMSDEKLLKCLKLLDENLGSLYSTLKGPKWKTEKRTEMQELGLVYIMLYRTICNGKSELVGFVSCKIINETDLHVLYLYEIQLAKSIQGLGVGSILLKELDEFVICLNKFGKIKKLWYREYPEEYTDKNDESLILTGVALTVFTANTGAMKLYKKLGYIHHCDSPRVRILRSGKKIIPDYYILEKKIITTTSSLH